MTLSTMLAVIWVFAATGVALLPMRLQFPPGIILIIAAPFLIIWLGVDFGWIIGAAAMAAFISMFRNPIRYYWRKWRAVDTNPDTTPDTNPEARK